MQQDQAVAALEHMRLATTLLDKAEAPGHIAAHVELAIFRLETAISTNLANIDLSRLLSDRNECGAPAGC